MGAVRQLRSSVAVVAGVVACSAAPETPSEPASTSSGAGGASSQGGRTGGMGTGGAGTAGAGPAVGGEPAAPGGAAAFSWPDGKRGAVSLTYDDGLDGQLRHAVPALDARGLRATFFIASFPGIQHGWALPDTDQPLTPRHEAWAAVATTGHEIGGHTVHHPCASNGSGFRPDDYDLSRMAAELDESLVRIARLGADPSPPFAYPCRGDEVGLRDGVSYQDLVTARFASARGSAVGVADPATVDLTRVPQRDFHGPAATGSALIAHARAALESGGWAVFTFHGVGSEAPACPIGQFDLDACALNYLSVSADAHEALLDYLAAETDLWTAPFGEVATALE